MRTGWRSTLLLAFLAAAALSGCGAPSAANHAAILRLPLYGQARRLEIGLLDPSRASSATPPLLASLLQSGLVKFGPDLHVIPELAISIPTISTNGKSYTFTIRQDAKFADGRACTAADVVYSFTHALAPGASVLAKQYLGGIEGSGDVESGASSVLSGVKALGRLTVRIRLSRPDASFLDKLAFPIAAVVEPGSGAHPAGLGPFMLNALQPDGTMTLVRRPHYYDDPLGVGHVTIVPVTDPARGLDLYRKGLLDAAYVPFNLFASLQNRQDFHQSDALDAYYALPSRDGLALAGHLNRDSLVAHAGGALSTLSALVPPSVPDYVASPPPIDPPAASTSLPGVTLSFDGSRDLGLRAVAAALSLQWPANGRQKVLVRLLHQSYLLPEPDRWLLTVLPQTHSRWLRGILAQGQALTNDPVSRMNLYSEAENWAIGKGLVIPLAGASIAYLIKPAVQNVQMTPLGPMPENNAWNLVTLQ